MFAVRQLSGWEIIDLHLLFFGGLPASARSGVGLGPTWGVLWEGWSYRHRGGLFRACLVLQLLSGGFADVSPVV